MAKYTENEKFDILQSYYILMEKGKVEVNKVVVSNIREFVFEVGISSYTLYKWRDSVQVKDLDFDVNNLPEIDIDEQILDGDADWFGQEKKKSTGEKNDVFGIRYYAWFARNLGVKGYSSMVLAQLKLAIGNKLIEQSGLIDMNKASRKLKQNGDNL